MLGHLNLLDCFACAEYRFPAEREGKRNPRGFHD
jgi:hypothetical protein